MTALDARLARIVESLRSRGPEYAPLVEALCAPSVNAAVISALEAWLDLTAESEAKANAPC